MKGKALQLQDIPPRILCLSACVVRSELEGKLRGSRHAGEKILTERWIKDINEWLSSEKITDYLLQEEKEQLKSPPGSWTEEAIIDFSWQSESLGVLMWAMGLVRWVPPVYEPFSTVELLKNIPFLMNTAELLEKKPVCTLSEIEKLYFETELWNWRVQVQMAQQRKLSPPSPWTWSKIIRITLIFANRSGLMPKPLDDDFPCRGKPFRALSEEEIMIVSSTTIERMRGLGWMAGFLKNWSDDPLKNKPSENPFCKESDKLPYKPI